jgi:hypothetical protein
LAAALVPVTGRLTEEPARIALLINALQMTGYDLSCRHVFTEWNRVHKTRISRVAIVTEKVMWRAVIAGMALASGQTMKAFSSLDEATRWTAG